MNKSKVLWQEAKEYIPGGVNSPVRAFKSVGMDPLFIDRGAGSKMYDVDGNEYIDYVMSWGPLILGHAHPRVVNAVKAAIDKGTSFGAPTAGEVALAKMINTAYPSMELVRLVNSGTEALMSAIRLARGYTKRDKIIKFEGCYHGHADSLLVKAGSGMATFGIPDSLGVPADIAKNTITLPFNDLEAVRKAASEEVACLVVEPVAGNMGVVPPRDGYLAGLREITAQHGIVLIFDEVITGFRVAYGGAQELYGIKPDITCLGKIIGGGLPIGAYGGKREIMSYVAPLGGVYQAGTLSGNPVAVAAGIETLKVLSETKPYKELDRRAQALSEGIGDAFRKASLKVTQNCLGSMMTTFFTDGEVVDYTSAKKSDTERYARYFRGMLGEGVYLAPSQFEAAFLSTAHSEADVEKTIRACHRVLKSL